MATKIVLCTILMLPLSLSFLFGEMDTVHIYVGPKGSDDNPGHEVSHPLKTISKAISLLSRHDVQGKEVFIELLKGYHGLSQTVSIGTFKASHVTIRSYNQQEVHVTGGKQIAPPLLKAVTDHHILTRIPSVAHGKVKQVSLSDAGITDLGQLSPYGYYKTRVAPLEIFFNGRPMRLARWPNEGHGYVNVAGLVDGKDGVKFKYSGTRASNWVGEPDVWAHGFWYWSWADRSVKIKSIDTSSKTITLENKPLYGLRVGHFHQGHNHQYGGQMQGGYYRVINALSELDEPGEYYIDRTSGILYMWPPNADGNISSHDVIYGSMIDTCFSLSSTSNIAFEDFTLESCRLYGMGLNLVTGVTFQEMEIKNTGSYNIHCINCVNTTVTQSSLHDGDGGIEISGGSRVTLTPSHSTISNSHIWSYSREAAVGDNAITMSGVGVHVHHNEINNGQYTGIRWAGNDHIMEYNHIHHNCMNSSDCGAIHSGRDWTWRGNIIRYNYVHHTLRTHPGADVRGIMLDDQYSSVDINDNVFYDNDVHVNIGGGRDNTVRRNIFYNAVSSSMQMDSRGQSHGNDAHLISHLHAVPYNNSLWKNRYPKLATIDSNHPSEPRGNQIIENIFFVNGTVVFRGTTSPREWYNISGNHMTTSKYDFTSPEAEDFRPRCGLTSYVNAVHFPTPVPISKVGPQLPVGPSYLRRGFVVSQTHVTNHHVHSCPSVKLPAASIPKVSYLPDGSKPNTLYSVSKQGCWFRIEKCPNHPNLAGNSHNPSSYLHRDTDGEQHLHTGTNETACLERVPYMVNRCGSASSFSVIYGPTGAMTLGGEGCFFAQYSCSKYGNYHTGFVRDSYAEHHSNAAHNEHNCLARAVPQWVYCGSNVSSPITSIYKPTGHILTAGGGCWLRVTKCPADSSVHIGLFYDAYGAANLQSDASPTMCFQRASDVWLQCGQHSDYPVTAYYRPTATSKSVNNL